MRTDYSGRLLEIICNRTASSVRNLLLIDSTRVMIVASKHNLLSSDPRGKYDEFLLGCHLGTVEIYHRPWESSTELDSLHTETQV